jgi:hypothetical protein
MPGNATTFETQSQPSVSTIADFSMLIVGYSSDSPVAAGKITPAYSVPAAAASDLGEGDAVGVLCQAIKVRPDNPDPPPAAFYSTPDTTPGSYRTIDNTGVAGTAVPSNNTDIDPLGTFQPWGKIVNGGVLGVDNITAYMSLNNGRHKRLVSLGTDTEYNFPSTDGWGVGGQAGFSFLPSTTNAAYVALAVELRADTLAHLANVTAHDAADTSAAQVLLAASSVPATVSASTAVVNLVLGALVSHVTNITAHDGPDLVAHTALALLSAATNAKEGIDLAIALKGIANTHMGVALAAAPAGLMGSTASVASPQTYTAAGNFLSGGVAAMDAQPRRPEFVISGSGTPADMADSVTITGFDYTGAAQTESGLSLTGLGTVKATKAFKGTGLSCALVAADGTGATFTVGYSNGGHNSADSTNTITSADPTYGTLLAGDTFFSKTDPPQWSVDDLYDAGDPDDITGAFAEAARSSTLFSTIVITEPVQESDFPTLTAGLDYGLARGKLWSLIVRFRDPNDGETDAQYILAFQAFCDANHDSRITPLGGICRLADALTGRVYDRSFLASYIARWQSTYSVRGSRRERLAQNLGWVARGPLSDASVRDAQGNPTGHDESIRSGIEGTPGAATGRGVALCYRDDVQVPGTYITNRGSTMYGVLDPIVTPQDRRVVNAVRQLVRSIILTQIGSADITDGAGNLDPDLRTGLEGKCAEAIESKYGDEFQGPSEGKRLVDVDAAVTTDGAHDTITGTVNMKLYSYEDTLTFGFSVTR